MSEVEKEGFAFIFFDEADGMLGVPGGDLVLMFVGDLRYRDFIAIVKNKIGIVSFALLATGERVDLVRMKRPHVIRVRETEVFIEAVAQRKKLRGISQMPLAEDGGCVAALFD